MFTSKCSGWIVIVIFVPLWLPWILTAILVHCWLPWWLIVLYLWLPWRNVVPLWLRLQLFSLHLTSVPFREHNAAFSEVRKRLEEHSICQGLPLQSFFMLPMQRITRLPLLIVVSAQSLWPLRSILATVLFSLHCVHHSFVHTSEESHLSWGSMALYMWWVVVQICDSSLGMWWMVV